MGPWSHGNSRYPHSSYGGVEFGPEAALELDVIHLAWCDYWLKGVQNAVMQSPPALLFQTGDNVWRDANQWPLATGAWSLYLDWDGSEGRLQAEPAATQGPDRAYRYDPLDLCPTRIDVLRYATIDVPLKMNEVEARPDVLGYTSEPLAKAVTVSGWPVLEFWASSDRDDTEWHVKLIDVDAEGRSIKVCQGCRRASYRDSLEEPEPLTPGQPTRFQVELWPVQHLFRPGHRIRVTITSIDFPWFARSLNQFGPLKDQTAPLVAVNTLHHGGEYRSRVLLPVEQQPAEN